MTTLGRLLADIWVKDSSFRIEQAAFSSKVMMINKTEGICIETDGLAKTIETVWRLLYRGDA